MNILQIYIDSIFLLFLEALVTAMLIFETFYRGIMQGWKNYLEQKWNLLDVFVIICSATLLWIGIKAGGGIGEIDAVTAVIVIVARSTIQFLRLILNIRKKKAQDVQVIDLNDMSEGDEIVLSGEKNNKNRKQEFTEHKIEEDHKQEYQDSQANI